MADNSLTIFMYPWFAMGHLIPYLHTANKLAARGHRVFLVVPPKTLSNLEKSNLHPDFIKLIPLPLPHVEGLPPHIESSTEIPIHLQPLLRYAMDLTEPTVESLLQEIKPHFTFSDMMCWVPFLAHRLGIKAIHYAPVSPASMGFLLSERPSMESHMNNPPGFPPSIKLYKHVIRRLEVFDSEKEVGSGLTIKQRLRTSICESDAIGFKTCRETEGPYIEYIENNFKKPVLLAGPIVPKSPSSFLEEKWERWLDKFRPKSVIYCAFGSEAILQKDQFQELVLGLERSGHPFFAALKPPFGSDTVEEALPEGLKERTQEKGVVYGGWVQQQLILKHPSVGCFVTHGGYASLWEGLVSACQLVVLPHVGEHYIQAKVLSAHLKVGVEVEKGDEDGLFTKKGVNEAIRAVMEVDNEIGKEVKRNHDKLRDFLLSKGLGDSYIHGFVQKMRSLLE
ncbi:anthocyanidin 3-O-glucoside 2''-O-glucosyltransferase-like [Olea europaea var. sylvestris]|uniref:anthocyanidin 3-O-glucoside 2''-O-glucosyltransferase-like n=1 Tax=Olea europaea var. sylvestris TaxID=158386 RepID=UPI000C1D11E0|nr:anthocyanidin 3-O-glucoside 2''-O-glucosyltransferase-like [Olea europaea var. sylvestris]XP_022853758.1 anthocyanidin 3-O-glucoside 2''-O-glucosyltransferase-like [Olea europaea var. sylvestris]XP_022853759.1 anthocyanidin 3-O-glucoside 2''-O-glucosyltransferase-like [Olea europaea var. sylvestris]